DTTVPGSILFDKVNQIARVLDVTRAGDLLIVDVQGDLALVGPFGGLLENRVAIVATTGELQVETPLQGSSVTLGGAAGIALNQPVTAVDLDPLTEDIVRLDSGSHITSAVGAV